MTAEFVMKRLGGNPQGSKIIQAPAWLLGFNLMELLVSIAIIGIVAAVLLPGMARARRLANDVECRSNLRQLGILIRFYADENAGRLPTIDIKAGARSPSEQGLRVILSGAPAGLFRCREDKNGRFLQIGSSYDWNLALNGRFLHMAASDPDLNGVRSSAAMLYDHENWHQHRNAVFLDGHAGKLFN